MMRFAKRAFTLIEVNLAMFIMAGGILSVIGLYSLGYRESRQSREDVASAAFADAVLAPIEMALSSTNLPWSVFSSLGDRPSSDGWGDYIDYNKGFVSANPATKAKAVYDYIKGKVGDMPAWPSDAAGGLEAGLVLLHEEGSPVATLAFRAVKNRGELLSAPLYYTEVRFQGRKK